MPFSFEPVSRTRVNAKITDGNEKQIVKDRCETFHVRAKILPDATLDIRGRIKVGQLILANFYLLAFCSFACTVHQNVLFLGGTIKTTSPFSVIFYWIRCNVD